MIGASPDSPHSGRVRSVSPDDRDRGLRVAGTLTGAVAAITLVAVGGTTALAASKTRDQDAAKQVAAAVPTEPAQSAGSPGSATPTVQPTGKPKQKKAKADGAHKKRKKVKVTSAAETTGGSAGAGGSTSAPSSTGSGAGSKTTPATTTTKATTKTSTTTPKPSTTTATTTTSSPAETTTTPPAVPTSAS